MRLPSILPVPLIHAGYVSNGIEGSAGTAVSAANSGFHTVTVSGTGTSITYDSIAHNGSTSAKIVTGASASAASMQYSLAEMNASGKTIYGRAYFYFTGTVAATTSILWLGDASASRIAELRVSSTANQLRLENAAGSAVASPTDTISINNQWIRVEWKVFSDASAGTIDVRIYKTSPDATTADFTYSATSAVLNGNDPALFNVGIVNGALNVTYYVDDVAWSDSDWIGPSSTTNLSSVTSFTGLVWNDLAVAAQNNSVVWNLGGVIINSNRNLWGILNATGQPNVITNSFTKNIGFIQSASTSTGSRVLSTTISLPTAISSGDLLVGWFGQFDGSGQLSVSDNINGSWTRIAGTTFSGGTGDVSLFYKENSLVAASGVTVTVTAGSSTFIQGGASVYRGMLTSGSFINNAVAKAVSAAVNSGSTASDPAGSLAFSGIITGGTPGTVTLGSNNGAAITSRSNTGSNSVVVGDVVSSNTGPQQTVATFQNTTDWYSVAAAFQHDSVTAANSGFDFVSTLSNGATFVYDTPGYSGSAVRITTGSTGSNVYGRYSSSFAPPGATIYGRAYIYFGANPASAPSLMGIFNSSVARMVDIRVSSTGKIFALDSTNATILTTTSSIALNQWVRVEWKAVLSASVGLVEIKLFNTPDSTTATEDISTSAAQNLLGTVGTYFITGITNSAANNNFMLDEIGWSDTSFLGAVGSTTTPVSATSSLVWNNVGRATNSAGIVWNDIATITPTYSIPWNITTSMTPATKALVWNDLIGAATTKSLVWNDLQSAATSRTLLFNVISNNPPLLRVGNTFNGTSGGTINTSSTFNSGVDSGIAFEGTSNPVNTVLQYDNTHAHSGSTSLLVSTSAVANVWARYQNFFRIPGTINYGRAYIWLPVTPITTTTFHQVSDANGAMFSLRINTAGKISIWDSAGSNPGALATTNSISTGQWVRVEWKAVYSSTVGQVEVKLFNSAESTSPTETLTSPSNLNLRSNTPINYYLGITNGASGVSYWIDDYALSVTNYPGPSGGYVLNRTVGAATTTGFLIAGKAINCTNVRLVVSVNANLSSPVFSSSTALDSNGAFRLAISGLTANTQYYYGVECDGTVDVDAKGSAKTYNNTGSLTFVAGSTQFQNTDDSLFNLIRSKAPEFVQFLGDWGYKDGVGASNAEIQQITDEGLNNIRQQDLFANVPFNFTWSFHDYTTNVGGDSSSATLPFAQASYRSRYPYYTLPDSGNKATYFSFTRQLSNHTLYFISTDDRSYISPLAASDNASKTKLGAEQKAWLKAKCLEAKAAGCPVVVIFLNDAWSNGAHSAGDNIAKSITEYGTWEAYTTERGELTQFFKDNNILPYFICGVPHALAADDGTNTTGNFPMAVAGPFNNTSFYASAVYSQGVYPTANPSPSNVQQFGLFTVTDTSSSVSISFRGKDGTDTSRISMDTTFNLPTTVTSTSSLLWNINIGVSKNNSLPWNIFQNVSTTDRLVWNLSANLSKTVSMPWNILGTATKTCNLPWNVNISASNSYSIPWNIFTPVSANTTALVWNILTLSTVTSNCALRWNLLTGISGQRSLPWNILQTTTSPETIVWNIRATVTSTDSLLWNNRALVIDTVSIPWNNLSSVTSTKVVPWNILQTISQTKVILWSILASTGVVAPYRIVWNIKQTITKSNVVLWTLAGGTERQVNVIWNIRRKSSITKTMLRGKKVYVDVVSQMAERK